MNGVRKSYTRVLLRDLSKFSKDKFNRMFFYFAIGFNVGNWIGAHYIITHIERETAYLHYNVDFGVDYIGDVERIYDFPLVGLAVIIVNILVSLFVRNREKFVVQMLLLVAIMANIFILMGLASIYLINFH